MNKRVGDQEYQRRVSSAEQHEAYNCLGIGDAVWLDLRDSRTRIAELEAQLSTAAKDTERLDWIINDSNDGNGWLTEGVWEQASTLCPIDEADDIQTWVRAAIDATVDAAEIRKEPK